MSLNIKNKKTPLAFERVREGWRWRRGPPPGKEIDGNGGRGSIPSPGIEINGNGGGGSIPPPGVEINGNGGLGGSIPPGVKFGATGSISCLSKGAHREGVVVGIASPSHRV